MSLFEELIEDKDEDKKIIKSFKPKDSLSEQIFEGSDGEFSMRDDIRKNLLKISNDFIESLGIEFFIHDIVLTGSLANYNWSNYSDVDLHVLIDFKETDYNLDLLKEFFDAKKNVWNEKHNITIKGYDVELYVQDVDEKHVSSGVYSVLNNKWIVEPQKTKEFIDDRKIIEKGEEYMKLIDRLIEKSKTNLDLSDQIESLKSKIKRFRQSGLEQGGEYSYENLTFKLLRRNGYIHKLLTLKTDITDKKLSITQ
jgi:predicted nucleotidyltransferase